MGKINELIHQFYILPQKGEAPAPIDAEAVKQAIIKKIEQFDIDGVTVEDVDVDEYGIMVTFVNYEDDQMDVYFVNDSNEGPLAIILGEEEDSEYLIVDLASLAPSFLKHGNVDYINLTELSWLNKSCLGAILMAGEVGNPNDDDLSGELEQDDVELEGDEDSEKIGAFRPVEDYVIGTEEEITELFAQVIRGGKKVKLAVVRKIKRKRLSATKRMGIRRAARKRKQKAKRIARKIKKALRIRKRMGLKKKSYGKFRKIAGTANRQR